MAHGRRLQTVMYLLQAVEKKTASVLPFSGVFLLLCLGLLSGLFFSVRSLFLSSVLSLFFLSLSLLLSRFHPFFLSFSVFLFGSPSSRFVLSVLSFFLPCVRPVQSPFIRGKGAEASLLPPYYCAWGARSPCPAMAPSEVTNGCGLQGTSSGFSSSKGVGIWFLAEHEGGERGGKS